MSRRGTPFWGEIDRFPNVFVLKAFTKLYAMAGVRLGYGFCSDGRVLEAMERVRQPWSVSALAQAGGEAALKETEYVEKTRRLIRAQREFLKKRPEGAGLCRLGFHGQLSVFLRGSRVKGKTAGAEDSDPVLRQLSGAGRKILPDLRADRGGEPEISGGTETCSGT